MRSTFHVNNRKKIIEVMNNNSILLLFSGVSPLRTADETYHYCPNRNFYYMTGLDRENMILFIHKTGSKLEEKLFIENVSFQEEIWTGKRMTKDKAMKLSGINDINNFDIFKSFIEKMLHVNKVDNIYLDLERRDMESRQSEGEKFAEIISSKYKYINIENIYYDICEQRKIKSPEEVEEIKKAITITGKGIERMMKNSSINCNEQHLEGYFNLELALNLEREPAFKSIVSSGANGIYLHYTENSKEIKDGELVLCDVGAMSNLYCADISRAFPVNGKFTDRQKQIYNASLEANKKVIKFVRPGVSFPELNAYCRKILAEECKKIGLITKDEELKKYYYHGVSHYLGLDVHDVGSYDTLLQPGMVITIDAGLYIKEENIGLRVEDNVLVTENGSENLSECIIKEIDDIERLMKSN